MTINLKIFKNNLTALILCGGRGQRLKPLTNNLPKPLIRIKNKEILSYIIEHLLSFKINHTLVLAGYKSEKIKEFIAKKFKNKISYLNTGLNTDILQRIRKSLKVSRKYILVCYGDTLLNININSLIKFHIFNNCLPTLTIYKNPIKFGLVKINKKKIVTSFLEKPDTNVWINVGFFLFEKKYFKKYSYRIKNFKTFLEKMGKNNFLGYEHKGVHITVNNAIELSQADENIKKLKRKRIRKRKENNVLAE